MSSRADSSDALQKLLFPSVMTSCWSEEGTQASLFGWGLPVEETVTSALAKSLWAPKDR